MKVLSFTILATVLLALFIPNIAATNDVRGHVEEKEDIGGGHRALLVATRRPYICKRICVIAEGCYSWSWLRG
jgi:hypothetical protein